MAIRDWFAPTILRVRPTYRTRPVADWRYVTWTSSAVWKKVSLAMDGYDVEFAPRYAPPTAHRFGEAVPECIVRNAKLTMNGPPSGWVKIVEHKSKWVGHVD